MGIFPHLFRKGKIGRVELKNRLLMAPMGIGTLVNFDALFSQRAMDFYAARARGGVGAIISTVCLPAHSFEPWGVGKIKVHHPTFDHPFKLGNLRELTEKVHDHGCKFFMQLTAGWGRIYFLSPIDGHKPFAPSALPLFWHPELNSRELTLEEIEGLAAAMGNAASLAREGGCDGLELHGHEGYLLDQFKTALWNHRKDKFGGDLMGRMQFPLAVIKEIQRNAGDDFPIIYRYGLEHKIEGGRTREEGLKIGKILEEAGVSALHIDAGCYENWYWPHPPDYQPPGCMVEMAEQLKRKVEIPVITVGRLGYPELADSVIHEGKADFVALGRPLLADPEFSNKARRGRAEDIRPCIGCHECFRRLYEGTYISCAVNPACGNEERLGIRKAETPKKIMVIGGGIAGLEAARVSSLRGHQVTLYEKSRELGGLLRSVSRHSLKGDLRRLLDYQISQVLKNPIKIKTQIEANGEVIRRENPDIVFLATGSVPLLETNIQKGEKHQIFTPIDILEKNAEIGSSAVVIGGGSTGCEVAYELAEGKRQVTILEELPDLARDLFPANRSMLFELLRMRNIHILTNCRVVEVVPGRVIYEMPEGMKKEIETESVVMALGRQSVNGLFPQIHGLVEEVYAIGDCVTPRKVINAIWDAYKQAIWV